MLAAVAAALVLVTQAAQAAQVAVAMVALTQALTEHQVQPTQAVVLVAIGMVHQQQAMAVPALLSCPTPCQKAQPFSSCLLRHGKHQQAFLPLTTWWSRVVAAVVFQGLAVGALEVY
jgi:hypothetical protein